jgi:hypothetical protein
MPTSKVPAVCDALVTAMHAIFDPLGVLVLDGPEPTAGQPDKFAAVGYDGDPSTADDEAVGFTQTWEGLGPMNRSEVMDITCCVAVLSAETVKAARDAVFALFAAVELNVRTPGLWPAGVWNLEISAGSFHPIVTDEAGTGGRLPFVVTASCHI